MIPTPFAFGGVPPAIRSLPRPLFRAAQYDERQATRYITTIKEKVAQGLALTAPPS